MLETLRPLCSFPPFSPDALILASLATLHPSLPTPIRLYIHPPTAPMLARLTCLPCMRFCLPRSQPQVRSPAVPRVDAPLPCPLPSPCHKAPTPQAPPRPLAGGRPMNPPTQVDWFRFESFHSNDRLLPDPSHHPPLIICLATKLSTMFFGPAHHPAGSASDSSFSTLVPPVYRTPAPSIPCGCIEAGDSHPPAPRRRPCFELLPSAACSPHLTACKCNK